MCEDLCVWCRIHRVTVEGEVLCSICITEADKESALSQMQDTWNTAGIMDG